MNLQLEWAEDDLLATDKISEPLIVGGVPLPRRLRRRRRASPPRAVPGPNHRLVAAQPRRRVRHRPHRRAPVPLARDVPERRPSQFLIAAGVREPIVTTLARIGTVEGFGAMIRYANVGDPQRYFDEAWPAPRSHLHRGLFEAHARDEAGFEAEAGHKQMWFAA